MNIEEIKWKWDGQGKALSAAEIDFLISEVDRLTASQSIAASRLADQEAIERHVSKRVAREILLIMECSESYEDAVSEIRNQYGVE